MNRLKHVLALLPLIGLTSGGCDGSPGYLGTSATLSGQIQDWTQGAGYQVVATVYFGSSPAREFATGSIDASGRFAIELPRGELLAPLVPPQEGPFAYAPHCAERPAVDPPGVKLTEAYLTAKKSGADNIPLQLAKLRAGAGISPGDLETRIVWSERDVRITGASRCQGDGVTQRLEHDLELPAGWSIVLAEVKEVTASPSGQRVSVGSFYTAALPDYVKWWKHL